MTDMPLDRRAFLTSTGALVVTLASANFAEASHPTVTVRPPLKGDQLSSYITVETDGMVVAYYGKIDGGQGLGTSIAQMVAEEIDVAYERVRVVMGDSALTLDMGGASAAIGVSHGGTMLRRTAAETRRLLVEMASDKLGVPVSELTVTDGVVHAVADKSKRVTYAALIGGRHLDRTVKWNGRLSNGLQVEVQAPLKKPADFRIIGQSLPRKDLPGKVFGTLEMVNDVRLPGMLHARMVRPTVAGAVPVKVDEASISHIAGAKVVWIKDLLAVVAEKEWNAVKAARALKVTWSASAPNFPGSDKLFEHIRKAPVVKREFQRQNGNFEEGIKQAVRIVEGDYEFPTQSHASMGPACAVADVRDDEATIWTSTQKPYDFSLLHRRAPGTAEGESACDLDVRHRLVRPQRTGRCDRRRCGAVEASRLAGARAIHAARGAGLGSERHRLDQPQPRRARRKRQGDRLREHQQGVLPARQQHPRGARRRRAGRTTPRAAA